MIAKRVHRWGAAVAALLLLPVSFVAVSVVIAAPSARAVVSCPSAPYGVNRYGPGSGQTVALTFDDGPNAQSGRILAVLAAKHVTATFFNIGGLEAAHPATVRAEAAGYAMGTHTMDHLSLAGRSAAVQADQMDRGRRTHAAITGSYPCLFRPPYGNYDATTLLLAQQRGMRVWNWSVDTEDWKVGADPYGVQRIIARAEAGTYLAHPVILMHNLSASVAALPAVIDYYRARHYVFVDLFGNTGPPSVGVVSPNTGRTAGGARVTVTGTGFGGARAVYFGTARGTAIHLVSATKLLVSTPAHSAGRVDVRIVTDHGTSAVVGGDGFTYVARPSVTSVSPSSGPAAGGTRVRLYGADFMRVTAVLFGTRRGTGLHVVSSRQLLITTPAVGGPGTVAIQVATAYGMSDVRPVDHFTYVGPPPPG